MNSGAKDTVRELLDAYPSLLQVPTDELAAGLRRECESVEVSADTRLFEAGAPCRGFPLVLGGEIRVTHSSRDGRSVELYRVSPGEACVVSTAALTTDHPLLASGTTTRASRLLVLTPALFERWTDHRAFRRFVFGIFADRLADVISVVESVAFQKLDQRLAAYLLGHGQYVRVTHQTIAGELGTVREIITRLLNRFEGDGLVRLSRERIEILDSVRLRELSQRGFLSNLGH